MYDYEMLLLEDAVIPEQWSYDVILKSWSALAAATPGCPNNLQSHVFFQDEVCCSFWDILWSPSLQIDLIIKLSFYSHWHWPCWPLNWRVNTFASINIAFRPPPQTHATCAASYFDKLWGLQINGASLAGKVEILLHVHLFVRPWERAGGED